MLRRRLAHDLGDPEIEELHGPVLAEEHVPRLHVAVHDPLRVGGFEGREHVHDHGDGLLPREGFALAKLGIQRPTHEALGDDERAPVRGGAEIVRGHDVRVGDEREGPRLHPHPIRGVGDRVCLLAWLAFQRLLDQRPLEHLDRDPAPEHAVVALEHLRHAADRDPAEDPVTRAAERGIGVSSAPVTRSPWVDCSASPARPAACPGGSCPAAWRRVRRSRARSRPLSTRDRGGT